MPTPARPPFDPLALWAMLAFLLALLYVMAAVVTCLHP